MRFQENELKKTIWRNSRCSKDQNVGTPVPVIATLWSPAIIRKRKPLCTLKFQSVQVEFQKM